MSDISVDDFPVGPTAILDANCCSMMQNYPMYETMPLVMKYKINDADAICRVGLGLMIGHWYCIIH